MKAKLVRESINEGVLISDDETYNEWYNEFIEALHLEFLNEDEENLQTLLEILDDLPHNLYYNQHKTPGEAAHIIANNEEVIETWYAKTTEGQENDDDGSV